MKLVKHAWLTAGTFVLGLGLATPACADDAAVVYNQGLILKRQGKTAEAIAEMKKAIAARKDYAAAWFSLGNLYRGEGDYTNAVQAYQKCTALQPKDAPGHANLGALYIRMKRIDDGI